MSTAVTPSHLGTLATIHLMGMLTAKAGLLAWLHLLSHCYHHDLKQHGKWGRQDGRRLSLLCGQRPNSATPVPCPSPECLSFPSGLLCLLLPPPLANTVSPSPRSLSCHLLPWLGEALSWASAACKSPSILTLGVLLSVLGEVPSQLEVC
jgi:hypothetical protein